MYRRGDDGKAERKADGRFVHDNAGEWDLEVTLLKAYQLRPWEVARLDPDFVQELLAASEAENSKQYRDWANKQAERANKRGGGDDD